VLLIDRARRGNPDFSGYCLNWGVIPPLPFTFGQNSPNFLKTHITASFEQLSNFSNYLGYLLYSIQLKPDHK